MAGVWLPSNTAAFLTEVGYPGQAVYLAARLIEDPVARAQYVLRMVKWLRSQQDRADELEELLVPIDLFVESPLYLNKAGVLYPEVMRCLVELCSGKYVEAVLTGAIGVAKALALDTPIPTPNGWSTMGDLRDGDEVFDLSGCRRKVLHAHPVLLGQPCYRVVFSDGSSIVADEGHLWRVWSQSQRRNKTVPSVLTTGQIRDSLHRKYTIEVAKPLDCEDRKDLGVDPYVLGAWLGDGSSAQARIWSADQEIVAELGRHYSLTRQKRPAGTLEPVTVHGIAKTLRRWGLLGNKHVPPAFLRASEAQRLALLQGLMDTDGTVDKKTGRVSFTTTLEALAGGVVELVRSLGWKPAVYSNRAKLYGKDCGPFWQVGWTPGRERAVFRLPRKLAYQGVRRSERLSLADWRGIVAVEPVPSVPVRCVTVDGPDSLYLAGESMVATHNTTIALYALAWTVYTLSCYRDPHASFGGLDPASEILIAFQNATLKLAKSVDYERFRAMLEQSPYFTQRFRFEQDLTSELRFPKRIIARPAAATDTGIIGQNVIGGLLDEMNFMALVEDSKLSMDGGAYDQAKIVYSSIARRRKSRFMVKGHVPGMLCLVSSKKYPGEFTDQRIEAAKTDPTIYVYDKRLWEIKPDAFTGQWFDVFVGDVFRKPRVLEPGEQVPESDQKLVHRVPEEFREEFEQDILNALRDILGLSTMAKHPFLLDRDLVSSCFGKVESIASREDTDFKDQRLLVYPKMFERPDTPRFVHIDLAVSQDSAGVAIGWVPGLQWVSRGPIKELYPIIRYDLLLEVKPPRGGEILFENIRQLLYVLRGNGLNLKWVTFDTYQSIDSVQTLRGQGFVTGHVSMDTSTLPYDVLKQALYDGRVEAPLHTKTLHELLSLERDDKKGLIDHPPRGSKDVSDAMAGVCYGLTLRREVWLMYGANPNDVPATLREQLEKVEKKEAKIARSETMSDDRRSIAFAQRASKDSVEIRVK